MRVEVEWPVEEAAWFALRADGDKVDEAPIDQIEVPELVLYLIDRFIAPGGREERQGYIRGRSLRPSAAHTGPIYVAIAGRPGLAASPAARERARAALERLDEIEARFSEERIDEYLLWPLHYSDGIPAEQLRRDRPAVLRAIEEARNHYRAMAR
jgi:hypothetical protein